MQVVLDIETDSLTPTRIWLAVVHNLDTDVVSVCTSPEQLAEAMQGVTTIIGHNILSFDLPAIEKLWGLKWPDVTVYDTLIIAKYVFPRREEGYSLGSFSSETGLTKSEFTDFSSLSKEMIEYCIRDVQVNHRLWLVLRSRLRKGDRKAIEIEHEIQKINDGMSRDGFAFDRDKALALRADISRTVDELYHQMQLIFPPIIEKRPRSIKIHTFNPASPKQVIDKLTEFGWRPVDKTEGHKKHKGREKECRINLLSLEKSTIESITKEIKSARGLAQGSTITLGMDEINKESECYRNVTDFLKRSMTKWFLSKEACAKFVNDNVNSWSIIATPKDLYVDFSATSATECLDGTKSFRELLKNISKTANYRKYGYRINENNLSTLPNDAPEAAREIVKYLLLVARVRKLDEWIGAYNESTHSIHGRFDGLGTWTHRFAHSNPNMGNIAAEKSIKYKGEELSRIATRLGGEMRSLWIKHPDSDYLVGTDADSIQLRIFAHYINDRQFTEALVAGKKEDKTDVHSLNARILGGIDRDTAKTFIYAFLLGAGLRKLAEILARGTQETDGIVRGFVSAYPGLRYLKDEVIPADARRGYFLGLDGRRVSCHSEHHMLAGYLQTGEAVIMKHANVRWRYVLSKDGIWYRQVNFVHDEWQTEGRGNKDVEGRYIGQVQSDAITWAGKELGCLCPLAGESKIGNNWHETH